MLQREKVKMLSAKNTCNADRSSLATQSLKLE